MDFAIEEWLESITRYVNKSAIDRHSWVGILDRILEENPDYPEKEYEYLGIAYTNEYGKRVVAKVGRYLRRHFGELVTDIDIERMVARYPVRVRHAILQDHDILVAMTDIDNMFCDSCMVNEEFSVSNHPYNAYTSEYGWGLAVSYLDDHIVARALVNGKRFLKIYEATASHGNALLNYLMGLGYERIRDWEDYTIKIKENCYAPYIDGGVKRINQDGQITLSSSQHPILLNCTLVKFHTTRNGLWGYYDEDDSNDKDGTGELVKINGDFEFLDDCVEIDDKWYLEEDCVLINDGWYLKDDCIEIDDEWYLEEDCVLINDGWYLKEDCIEINGNYYLVEDCVLINDKWYLEEDCVLINDGWYLKEDCVIADDLCWHLKEDCSYNAERGIWTTCCETT